MNVDLNNIDDLFLDSLENIEVKPSATVKENIKKRMFYHNLMKNTYLQMGVFAFFTIILTSFVWFYLNSSINNIAETVDTTTKIADNLNTEANKITAKNSNNIEINNTTDITNVNTDNESIISTDNKIVVDNYEEDNTSAKLPATINNNQNIVKKSQNKLIAETPVTEQTKTEEVVATKQTTEITDVNSVLPINMAEEPKTNNITAKNTEAVFVSNKTKVDNRTPQNIAESNNTVFEQNIVKNKHEKENKTYNFLDYRNSVLLSQQINTQTLKLAELQIPDDTVGYNMNNEPIVLPSNHWYADLYFSPNYSNSNFTNNSTEFADISDKLNSETSADLGFSVGLNAGYKFKNFAINLGVAYSEFNQKFDAKYNEQILTNVDYYEYTTHNEWQLDTTYYWNLDSLIQGDSVMTPIIDSTQITLVDSTMQTRVDTSLEEKTTLKTNKYQYVEFPLTVEYVFNRGKKFSPFINGGLITGLLIKTSTYTYQTSDGTLVQDNNTPYIKPNFWLVFGAGVRYNLNNKYSLMVYPYYRYNLKSIIENTNIYGQKMNIFGVNFGVRYTF